MHWDEQQIPVIDSRVFRLKAELQTEHFDGCLLYDLYCGDILHGVLIQADAISCCTLRLGDQVKMSLYPQATKYTEWFASVSSSDAGIPVLFLRTNCFNSLVTLEVKGKNILPNGVHTLCSDICQEKRAEVGNNIFLGLPYITIPDTCNTELTLWTTI